MGYVLTIERNPSPQPSPIEVGYIRLRQFDIPNSGKPELGERGGALPSPRCRSILSYLDRITLHESSSPPQRPPHGGKTGPRRTDRRRQVRLDVPVAGAAYAGARGARDRRSRSA